MDSSPRQCASEVLEAIPLVMRVLRAQARSKSSPELSMPQFRALAFLGRNTNAMLSDVAMFLGLTLSATSKLVDFLVTAGFVTREVGSTDRRKVALGLTALGQRRYTAVVKYAGDYLATRIASLGAETRGELLRAMKALRSIFDDQSEIRRPTTGKKTPKP